MPLSHYKFHSAVEPPPRSHHFVRVFLTIVGIICHYKIGRNTPVLEIPCEVCVQSCNTVVKQPISQITLCCCITLKSHNLIYTMDDTFSYQSPKKSYAHAHIYLHMPMLLNSDTETLNILKCL